MAGRAGGIPQRLLSMLSWAGNEICPDSPDGKHHAASCIREENDGVHYRCVCNYCGELYTATEREVSDAYNGYVASLPAEEYDSAGELIWHTSVPRLTGGVSYG